jgi:hypothetical protein
MIMETSILSQPDYGDIHTRRVVTTMVSLAIEAA